MAEAHPSPELPPEILFCNILPRLPAKSLLRFKSVSKEWHSSLTTPSFEKLHLHHAIATNDHHQNNLKFLIFSTETEARHTFNASDSCEALDKDGLLTATATATATASQPFPFKLHGGGSENMTILASGGGLVCVGIYKGNQWLYPIKYSDLILWNPLTGDYKTLSKPINSIKDFYYQLYYKQRAFGLYYTSCDHDFKLLCVTHDLNAYTYSLKSDTWRKIDSSTEDLKHIAASLRRPYWLWPSITRNEKLYFLKHGQDSAGGLIIRFDTKTEKFTKIATPCFRLLTEIATPSLGNQYDVLLSLTVIRGCIHFIVMYFTSDLNCKNSDLEWQHVECWLMDEDGNWIKEVTLPKASYIIIEPLHPVNRGSQIEGSYWDCRASKLDLTRLVINVIPRYKPDCMYIPRGGKYIETLVSPNRRFCKAVQPLIS